MKNPFRFLSLPSLSDLAAENANLTDKLARATAETTLWKGVAKAIQRDLDEAEPFIRVGKARLAALDKAKAKKGALR